MTVIIAVTILTILIINILLAPLMIDAGKQKQGWLLLIFMTLSAMGLYLWHGSPYIPSQPALFETQGVNFEKRALVKKELTLTQDFLKTPDDIELMLALGNAHLKNGKLDQAIALLSTAHEKDPAHKKVSLKLGAAHYAAALAAVFLEDDKARAQKHFNKALEITPEDAPYREKLLNDIKSFQEDET